MRTPALPGPPLSPPRPWTWASSAERTSQGAGRGASCPPFPLNRLCSSAAGGSSPRAWPPEELLWLQIWAPGGPRAGSPRTQGWHWTRDLGRHPGEGQAGARCDHPCLATCSQPAPTGGAGRGRGQPLTPPSLCWPGAVPAPTTRDHLASDPPSTYPGAPQAQALGPSPAGGQALGLPSARAPAPAVHMTRVAPRGGRTSPRGGGVPGVKRSACHNMESQRRGDAQKKYLKK